MSILHIFLIAVGLAADAFAVSVAEGVALRKVTREDTLRVALYFGAFQGAMPVVGWLVGHSLRSVVESYDHWVAFGLLMLIGGKMVADALFGFGTAEPRNPSRGGRLIMLAIATSIDALAVGMSLAMLRVRIWTPAVIIGVVTGLLCATGIQMGDRIGSRLGRWAELGGGIILCLIGARILTDHLL
ncbi:MAG: manganese efflux pump [Candidatus Brocadiae bacterium]|nr:manganese efflux pump [Candidatus Brocadiia bacterium]